MIKRVLMLASVSSMIDQFNMSNIHLLQEMGYKVDVACNFKEGNTSSPERVRQFRKELEQQGIDYYQIDFARNISKIGQNITAYHQVKRLLVNGKYYSNGEVSRYCKKNYDFIHCHSPIGGAIGRWAAHKTKTKVIYTAHGFHFFKGASFRNWMIYYPVERFLSRYTDVLITINREDYERAKKFKAKRLEYTHGVGIDLKKFQKSTVEIAKIRAEIGIKDTDIVLLSVGELNENKNHEVILRALAKLSDERIHYIICGSGKLKEYLENLATKLGVSHQFKLLGYQTNICNIYKIANIFVLPSCREGLSIALVEAAASGLPCIVSKIRGNTDFIKDGEGGYLVNSGDVEGFAKKIKILAYHNKTVNVKIIDMFGSNYVDKEMNKIYNLIERG